jgi:hypothetical protein
MSLPTWGSRPTLAGDYDDDDGQVISDLVTTEAAPPDPFPAAAVPIPAPSPTPKRPTRLLTGTAVLDPANTSAPFLVLPEDVDRETFTIRVLSDNPSDFVLMGEEPNRVATPGLAVRVPSGQVTDYGDHTGPVWVGLPAQPNLAQTLAYDANGWQAAGGTLAAAGSVPWPSGQGVTFTATATGAFNIRTPALTNLFARSGQAVSLRAKLVTNLFSSLSVGLGKPVTSTLVTPSVSVVAPTQVGWKEAILTGVISTDAQGGVCLTVSGTAATIGDTVTIGDLVISDRAFQGLTTLTWSSVTK